MALLRPVAILLTIEEDMGESGIRMGSTFDPCEIKDNAEIKANAGI